MLLAGTLALLASCWLALGALDVLGHNRYVEAVTGPPTRLNPLAAHTNDAEDDLAALLFSGLMRLGPDGRPLPDLAQSWEVTPDGDWSVVTMSAKAPKGAAGVRIQLLLVNAPRATLWWDEVLLEPAPAPAARPVTVASVNLYPRKTADPTGDFLSLLERSLARETDVVLLPEGITVVGTGKSYADVAEAVPGPTTARLGEFARRRKIWLVAGLYEREKQVIYNTAVLIDREGRLAGRYRKVYIPREEFEGGITPGSDYPVFHTDFGTIGLMIC